MTQEEHIQILSEDNLELGNLLSPIVEDLSRLVWGQYGEKDVSHHYPRFKKNLQLKQPK